MRALQIIFGIILVLLALFTGGCSLGFLGALLIEPGGGGDEEIVRLAGTGSFVTPFLILFAWMSMRTPESELDPTAAARRMSAGRFLGAVALIMLALLMIGLTLLLQFFADDLDMRDVPRSRVIIYAVIGILAAGGAVWCIRRKPPEAG